jgi:two-component system phosphate regulon sensor histidine kinase PhoR
MQGIILQTNQAAAEILGHSTGELLGEFLLAPLGATDAHGKPINKSNAALFESIRRGKRIANVTRQFVKKSGERIWTAITTTPVRKKRGGVQGGIVVFRDITEQKREEEYRTDFAHIASHNLRTPLGNMLWAAEYLLSEKLGPLGKKPKEYLQDISRTLAAMNSLVNDLLSVSRLQSRQVKPRFENIPVENVVRAVFEDLAFYARAQNVQLELTTDNPRPHIVQADRNHLRTIIQNIIENAVRYAFPKTTIVARTEKQGREVRFSCTNEGIGIPSNKQKYIFAKFFRAGNAVEKQGEGTGLGLYITYELTKLNRGTIGFTSTVNHTTKFFVSLKAP